MLTELDGDDREEMRAEVADAEADIERLEAEIRLLLLPKDPNEGKNVIVEIRGAEGRRGGQPLRPRPVRDVPGLRRPHGLEARGARLRPVRHGRLQRDHVPAQGRRRVAAHALRGRRPPCPAGAGDGEPGSDPHLLGHGDRAPGGGGGRGRHRPQRPPDRRLPLVGAGRAEREHDRLGRAHHPQAHRAGRGHAGREEPDPEPGQGDAGAAEPPAEAGAGPSRRPRCRRSARTRSAAAAARRRSAPTTSRRTGSPSTASGSPLYKLDKVLAGELDDVVDALVADEQTRRLGESG